MYVAVFSYGYGQVLKASIVTFNNTLVIAVLAVALFKIKKLLNEVPQVA
jgi:hypothetical protein